MEGADFRPLPHQVGNTYGGYTDLQWAVFDGAVLIEARMNGADLRGATFLLTTNGPAELRCANLRGAKLSGVNFTDAVLEGADLTDAVFDAYTDFTGADVKDACFSTGHTADLSLAANNLQTVPTPLNCVPSFP